MSVAVRGDHPDYFGPRGRVRAARLFPLDSYTPGTPGLKLVAGENPAFEPLYAELNELLGRADALDPDSETGRRIAEVEAELSRLETAEAEALRHDFERSLLLPLDAGAAFARELADVLSSVGHPPSDHTASEDS